MHISIGTSLSYYYFLAMCFSLMHSIRISLQRDTEESGNKESIASVMFMEHSRSPRLSPMYRIGMGIFGAWQMSNINFFAYSVSADTVRKAKWKFFKLNLLLNSKLKQYCICDTLKELNNADIVIPVLPPFTLLVWLLPETDRS